MGHQWGHQFMLIKRYHRRLEHIREKDEAEREAERRETEIENTEAIKDLSTVIEAANKAIDEAEELINEMHLERTERTWRRCYGYTSEEMTDCDKELVRNAERTITQLKIRLKKVPQSTPQRDAAGRFLPRSDMGLVDKIRTGTMRMHIHLVDLRRARHRMVEHNANMRDTYARGICYD